tara:strand:- start:838 stop:1359 length:522 start_codon:yes stop_codon:yes gene_type:complete
MVTVGGGGKVTRKRKYSTMQHDILNLRAKGLSYRQIAEKLNCSKATISYWLDPNGKAKVVARNKRYKSRSNGKWASRRGAIWKYNYLLDKHCEKCGEDNMLMLQFDHKGGHEKHSNITDLLNGNLNKLKNEVKKCRVLCANCHQKKTLKANKTAFYTTYKEREQERKKHGCRN